MRLLVVEDEHRLAERLAGGLREEGFAVDTASTVAEGRDRVLDSPYDLVLLDVKLPDGSGFELLREWRHEGFTAPILILTAKDLLEDKLAGLNAGADDYLTKPFAFEEVLARVHALLRRRGSPPQDILVIGEVRIDRTGRRVELAGNVIDLTPREFALLEFFALHPGQALSRTTIAEHVWDAQYDARSNVIDVIVARLRRKLEGDGRERLIHTVPGAGYLFRGEGAAR